MRRLLSLWWPNLPSPVSGAPGDAGETLRDLALWCQLYSPLTAADPPDGVMIDITGCAHLFGGEAGLAAHLRQRQPEVRLAIAGTAAAAWGLARYGSGADEDIAPLPLAALRLDAAVVTRMRRVGVRRVGQLMALPRAELAAGYGPSPGLRLGQALGRAPEVLRFATAPPDWREIEHHAEPIFHPAQLQGACQRLTEALCRRFADARLGATALTARFFRIDHQCPTIDLRFAAPSRDETHIARLLREKLQAVDPGFGLEAVSLEAAATEPLEAAQRHMEAEAAQHGPALDTVLNRLGEARVWRPKPYESHVPERAWSRMPAAAAPMPFPRPRHPRPIKLLDKPVEVFAIAELPDEPPASFTWAGKAHRVVHATGPERIAREWWRHDHSGERPEADFIRDYYAVEDAAGARFWLFRAGTHAGYAQPRWYIHGLFG